MNAKPKRENHEIVRTIKRTPVDIEIERIFGLMRCQCAKSFETHAVEAYVETENWGEAIKVAIRAIASLTPEQAPELKAKLEELLK